MIADYSPSHLYMILAASGTLGVISLFTQLRGQKGLSWPTWLIGRWAVALVVRERDRGWVYYILILGGLALVEPASGWFSTWSTK